MTQQQRLQADLAMVPIQLTRHPEECICNVCKEPFYLGDVVWESVCTTVIVHDGRCHTQWITWRRELFFRKEAHRS